MKEIGARVLVETVKGIADGTLAESPQTTDDGPQSSIVGGQSSLLKHAPKIFTETCNIDWRRSIDEIHNLIRGLSPFPCAFTELGDKTIKIFRGEKELSLPTSKPGRWESDGKTYLKLQQVVFFKRC
jgi:methionyl-tRNA formyltransferase